MKRELIILIISLLIIIYVTIFTDWGRHGVVVYDCSLSEISPDFPIEVREECRKIRREEYKKSISI